MIKLKGKLTATGPISVSYVEMNGVLPRTPHGEVYLNGGTLRGPLRNAALQAIRGLLAEVKGQSEVGLLSLTDMYMLGIGVDRTRALNNETDKGADPVGEEALRACNPFLSLFGRWRLPSRLEVSELRTAESNVVQAGQGVRHDYFERSPSEVDYLTPEDQEVLLAEARDSRRVMQEINELGVKVRELKRDKRKLGSSEKAERKRLDDEVKKIEKAQEDLRENKLGAKHSIKHPIAGYEAIATGSELSSQLTLVNDDLVYLGILIHALAEFARNPRLGGHAAVGFGGVTGEYEVYQWPKGEIRARRVGSITFDGLGLNIAGDLLQQAFDELPQRLAEADLSVHSIDAARMARGLK